VDAAFLMSPPLVVAYALAGTVNVDFEREPLARSSDGSDVYLRDLWPSPSELAAAMKRAANAGFYREVYGEQLSRGNPTWDAVEGASGSVYPWRDSSTYIKQPPYFTDAGLQRSSLRDILDARVLAIFGDSVTTDHISPIGNIAASSPAGSYLREHGVAEQDFNSYGARRMNHEVMTRGTFANRLIRNLMLDGRNGGYTRHWPDGEIMSIFDAAMRYAQSETPAVIFAGRDYGMGSARDWAAKGTRLLGVRAIVAQSFERIHRSNLAGMGVLPCQLPDSVNVAALELDGSETIGISGLEGEVLPGQVLQLRIVRRDGAEVVHPLTLRLDTPSEIAYAQRGGILPYVLDTL
jgi:aconitate hydratase